MDKEIEKIEFNPDLHLVTKSNALIEKARMKFSAMQQRIIHAALTQIPKGSELKSNVFYQIPLSVIADMAGQEIGGIFYKRSISAARTLRTATMVLKTYPDGSGREKTLECSIVQSIEYGDGELGIRFNEDAIPYLSGLKNSFTQYSVSGDLLHMDSAYAYRLHDLIARWGDLGTKEISVDDFRWMMGIDEGKYIVFSDFRKRAIEPAIREINEHSQYLVKVGYRRSRRRVVALQFAFKMKSDTVKKQRGEIRYITRSDVEKEGLARSGESWEQCIARLKKAKIIVK